MAQPIPSTNPQWAKDGWYQMPAVPGVVYADFRIAPPPHNWVWGKRHMIEFLIRLAEDWMFAFYDDQAKEFGNTAPIILGDISPEGGVGPNGSVKVTQAQLNQGIRVRGHSSHKRGVDVDIYAVRKDGQPRHVHADTKDYDLARTTVLANCIVIAGRGKIERIFFDDARVTSRFKPLPPGIKQFGPDQVGMHKDHFHVRLNEF
jgi:murein endopeptidase